MTVIALTTDEDTVALAADQEWTNESDTVFHRAKLRIVYDGDKAVGAIASAGEEKPGLQLEDKVIEAVRTRSIQEGSDVLKKLNRLMEAFRDEQKDFLPDSNLCEAVALLVLFGQGYRMDDSWNVLDFDECAAGCGALVARGAMWAMDEYDAETRAYNGCVAACDLVTGCGGPVDSFSMAKA